MPKFTASFNLKSDYAMSPVEAAYIAGIIDGEGTISLTRVTRKESVMGYRIQAYLSISNTSIRLLERVREMCGNGRLIGSYNKTLPHQKAGYVLKFSANQIRHILPQIRPYLILKTEQADVVCEFLRITKGGRHLGPGAYARVEQFYLATKALNKKGRPLDEQTPVPPQATSELIN